MTGIRAKIVLVLMVFFAGVATGVYLAAPVQVETGATETSLLDEAFRSDEVARKFRSGIDKYLRAGRAVSISVAQAIQERGFERDAVASAETTGQ